MDHDVSRQDLGLFNPFLIRLVKDSPRKAFQLKRELDNRYWIFNSNNCAMKVNIHCHCPVKLARIPLGDNEYMHKDQESSAFKSCVAFLLTKRGWKAFSTIFFMIALLQWINNIFQRLHHLKLSHGFHVFFLLERIMQQMTQNAGSSLHSLASMIFKGLIVEKTKRVNCWRGGLLLLPISES